MKLVYVIKKQSKKKKKKSDLSNKLKESLLIKMIYAQPCWSLNNQSD